MPKPEEEKISSEVETKNDANENVEDASVEVKEIDETQSDAHYVTYEEFAKIRTKLDAYEETLQKIMGGIKSIKDAQGIMVKTNGITIQDDSDPEPFAFTPLSEMDLSVK